MFINSSKVAAVGAFLAGGILVGGISFATVAHGQGTGAEGKGLSSAEYTAQQGWV